MPDSVPGCLILDIHMPGMDGWEVLRRIVKSGDRRPAGENTEWVLKTGAVVVELDKEGRK
ncbi:MAG: hypothetical protein KKD05_07265 [Candidatus Omnitrophica bacterium]|nr:hypothetical protein [Candidatus Omnitrophota bacterium]